MTFSSLNLGTQAMQVAQGVLNTIGHNIANINTEGYTRQRAEITANIPLDKFPGQMGTGVKIEQILRITDDFTRIQLQEELQKNGEYQVSADILAEIEIVLNEPTEGGLQSVMSDFFNSFQTLANAPEEYGTRSIVIAKADTLVSKLNSLSEQLQDIEQQTDELVRLSVSEINEITEKIAFLNQRISSGEVAEGQNANDLRDQRELLLRELNQIVNVTSYEDSNNNLFVEAAGSVLVTTTKNVRLGTSVNSEGLLVPVNENSLEEVNVEGGELKGILSTREGALSDVISDLDALAAKIIEEVNRLHSRGSSLDGFSSYTGNVTIENPNENLVNAGLPYTPKNGSLYITAINQSTGDYEEHEIEIDPYTDSVNDIIADINTSFGGRVIASLDTSNQLRFDAGAGYKFQFISGGSNSYDNTDFLLATGVNTFFSGNNAFTISVKDEINSNLNYIAAGHSLSPGDNTNAVEIANLINVKVLSNNQSTFTEYYSSMVSDVGQNASISESNYENQTALVNLLKERLMSTTGVSLEEEAANLIAYQRMFQAAAKYVQVLDTILSTIITEL